MSRSQIVPLLAPFVAPFVATVAMLSSGVASMTGCAAKVQTEPVVAPVAVVEATPAPAVVVPPPAPKLATICDAEIRPQGHLHFPHEVEFDEGKATIKSTATTNTILQCLVDFLNNNAMVTKFRIEGHTDNRGDAAMNQTLSDQRAQAVVSWLTAHNIPAGKVWGKGYGATRPVAPNDTPENLAKNRRVEFHIDELNGTKASKESIALAMNPPVVAVTSVAVPTTVSVVAPAPAVGVTVAAPVAGVAVVTPGVAVATPGVSVGIGIGGGAAAPGKGVAKKDDKKDEKKDDKKK